MKNKLYRIVLVSLMLCIAFCTYIFAGSYQEYISYDFHDLSLSDDGTASFVPPATTSSILKNGAWKKYQVQLLKRITTYNAEKSEIVFSWKTSGSVKNVKTDENEYTFNFTSVGYYQFQVRGEDLDGNYGAWKRCSGAVYAETDYREYGEKDKTWNGVSIDEEDISIDGGGGSGGSNYDNGYGPGTAQTANLPYGYQYAIVGPNGEIYYRNGDPYANQYNPYNQAQQQAQQQAQSMGPGYNMNNGQYNMQQQQQIYGPNTGISGYQQVTSPYSSLNMNSGLTNPNYSNNTSNAYSTNGGINESLTPTISANLQVGWNQDGNGKYYYQGNSLIIRGTWFLVDGVYYRFGDNGYLLTNRWFKDTSTGLWYYLNGEGRMLTGWQCINGSWYYFKPENGQGFGSMYVNTSIQITDNQWGTGVYAFDANGVCIRNSWFNGYYYDNDGKQRK